MYKDSTFCEDDEGDVEDEVDINSLKVKKLRFRSRRLGLKMTGNKVELKDRLSATLQDGGEDDED